MVQGRDMADWELASAIMAMLHNVNCAKKADRREPWDFDPFCAPEVAPASTDLKALKAMCERKKNGR